MDEMSKMIYVLKKHLAYLSVKELRSKFVIIVDLF